LPLSFARQALGNNLQEPAWHQADAPQTVQIDSVALSSTAKENIRGGAQAAPRIESLRNWQTNPDIKCNTLFSNGFVRAAFLAATMVVSHRHLILLLHRFDAFAVSDKPLCHYR
jgi:hypothetical protein